MGSLNGPGDQGGLFSRLPDDPEYWNSFTDRIVGDAVPTLRTFREDRSVWWSSIARFSTVLAAGATAATIVAVLLIPSGGQSEPVVQAADAYGLSPEDPLAVTLVLEQAPPTMETLIVVRNLEENR